MINYTERITLLIDDIVSRVPTLHHIDTARLLVFARFGRSDADGAYATCHCMNLPVSEPGYYFWRDRKTGVVTRRSEWFVTKSPVVQLGAAPIDYLLSFCLPRFCDQSFAGAKKCVALSRRRAVARQARHHRPRALSRGPGRLRHPPDHEARRNSLAARPQRRRSFATSRGWCGPTSTAGPRSRRYEFLRYDFDELQEHYGGVVGTTFRGFPSFPQRYIEVAEEQPETPEPNVRIEPLKAHAGPVRYTSDDLHVRQFRAHTSCRLVRTGEHRAA